MGAQKKTADELRKELEAKYFPLLGVFSKNMGMVSLLSDLQEYLIMTCGEDDKHMMHYNTILNEIKSILISEDVKFEREQKNEVEKNAPRSW